MNATVKRIGTIAAGSVLFFLLGRYVTIPSPIPTVNICVQYGLLAFLAVACGPLTGSMTGLIGHILIDLSGGRMFWSWIIATTAFGGLLGGHRPRAGHPVLQREYGYHLRRGPHRRPVQRRHHRHRRLLDAGHLRGLQGPPRQERLTKICSASRGAIFFIFPENNP